MKRIFYLFAVLMCQMGIMTAAAQDMGGKWSMDDVTQDLGDGIVTHTSGTWTFDNAGAAEAVYRVIGTMTQNGESVYCDLVIKGKGNYCLAGDSLKVNLEKPEKTFSMGKGTYENMGPAYEAKDAAGNMMITVFGSALYDLFSQVLIPFELQNVTVGSGKIEGMYVNIPVTLTKVD